MAEERLDGTDVVAVFQQMGRERVPKGVAGRRLGDSHAPNRGADGAL
jgi:hypothetical protein